MTRFRLVLLLLALGIALPASLIVMRATASLELEIADRHETVAERIFDEMERSLSDFLLREESRAVEDYDRVLSSTAAASDEGVAFGDTDEPFVLGWFSVSGAGSPRVGAREIEARARVARAVVGTFGEGLSTAADTVGGLRASQEKRDRIAGASDAAPQAVEPPVEGVDARTGEKKETSALAASPAPGRTRPLGRAAPSEAPPVELEEAQPETSAYEVLQSLNRASSLRSERQSKARKRSEERSAFAARTRSDAVEDLGEAMQDAVAPTTVVPGEAEAAGSRTRPSNVRSARARDGRAPSGPAPIVDPMIGRIADDGSLVLVRSVWRAQSVERQGLVIDRERLADWLRTRVLAETGLEERARLAFGEALATTPVRAASYAYLHRFAEPFDDLVARLDLEPLPSIDTTRTIFALAVALAIALALGLFAVDRMASVVLEYSRRRSDFVAAVSHELKTPLTAIRMYAEMLRDGLVSSEAKRAEYHATITAESERLSRLIDNVLEFSRLEQDRRTLVWVVDGLPETLRSVVRTLEPHARGAGFELVVEIEEGLPRVRYDRDAITQIVFNLVDNARKYAVGARSSRIELALVRSSAGGVSLRVRDDGPGVPDDQLERIFEPFHRVGEELTRTSKGSGIGLALVRELAREMGGEVRARRPAEGGFEVIVTLPPAGGG